MVKTEIRLIIFFAAKDGEALYSQQKQDWELTVAQIIIAKLKKVGKITKPFRYEINKISQIREASFWENKCFQMSWFSLNFRGKYPILKITV